MWSDVRIPLLKSLYIDSDESHQHPMELSYQYVVSKVSSSENQSTFKGTCRAWKVAPALAVGCTIVMKPSELTPLTALVWIPHLLAYQYSRVLS